MNKYKAHKIVNALCKSDHNKEILNQVIEALAETDCKHNDLSLRNNGQYECLNCGELFSLERLR